MADITREWREGKTRPPKEFVEELEMWERASDEALENLERSLEENKEIWEKLADS